jgi:uncharacterized repeat protein (TIGR02543 family)
MKNWKQLKVMALVVIFGIIIGFTACDDNGGYNNFTVVFELEGGNINGNTSSVSKTVRSGEIVTDLPNPEKENYDFDGWFTEKNGLGNVFTDTSIVIADLTVYAKWKELPVKQEKDITFYTGKTVTIKYTALPGTTPVWWDKLVSVFENRAPGFFVGHYTLNVQTSGDSGFVVISPPSTTATVSEAYLLSTDYATMRIDMNNLLGLWIPE